MSVIKKPDLKIFAQDAKTGEIETFPDVLRGWGITLDRTAGKPPLEWFNAIGKRVDEWLMYLTQRGVAEWDATLSYPKTAIVQWNGVIYVSNKETKGEQPDKSQAAWSTLGVFLGLGNYYTKTDTDTKFQLKGNYALKGESYTKVESDTRFQPKGNYLPSGYSYSKSESDTKYQPKGNYAPAGDYATNTALKSGLDGKFDKSGGVVDGGVTANALGASQKSTNSTVYLYPAPNGLPDYYAYLQYRIGDQWYGRLEIPRPVSGQTTRIMQIGECGVAGKSINLENGLAPDTQFTPSLLDSKENGFYAWGGARSAPVMNQYNFMTLQKWPSNYGAGIVGVTSAGDLFTYGMMNASWTQKITAYTTKNTTKDHNGNLKVSGSSSELSDYPVGAPIPWPQSTAPAGYLICNGQAFNKTTYPLLTKAYPSGKLPDLRGEFIRGLDAGRNIDNGRVVLSFQRCATEHHKHISGWGEASNANAIFGKTVKNGYVGSASTDRDNYLFYTNDGSEFQGSNPNSTGIMANETRPRNIAFLYIVRAA